MPSRAVMAVRPWLIVVIAAALTGSLVAAPAVAQQSSDEVRGQLAAAQDRLDELEMEIGHVVDEYNEAVEALETVEAQLAATEDELTTLRSEARVLENAVVDHVRRLHKLGPAMELSAVMVTGDAAATGAGLAVLHRVLDGQRVDLEELVATHTSVAAAEQRLEEQRKEADERTTQIEERREAVEATIADKQDEIDQLNQELSAALQREEEARRREEERRRRAAERARQDRAQQTREEQAAPAATPASNASAPASAAPAPRANAQVAVDAALSKLGSPYRWGATGPNSFDCSGLMVWAWAQAGVSLPRSSSAQFAGLRKISRSELQPGDLVFAGSPSVHHVGMYIGNGKIVHSPYTGAVVSIRSMERPDLRGFARPG